MVSSNNKKEDAQPCWYCKNIFNCSWGKRNIPRDDWKAVRSKSKCYEDGWRILYCPAYEDRRPVIEGKVSEGTAACPGCGLYTSYPQTICKNCESVHFKWIGKAKKVRNPGRESKREYWLRGDDFNRIIEGNRISDVCYGAGVTSSTFYSGIKHGFAKSTALKLASAIKVELSEVFDRR